MRILRLNAILMFQRQDMVDDGLNGEIPCYVVDAEFGPQPESAWDY